MSKTESRDYWVSKNSLNAIKSIEKGSGYKFDYFYIGDDQSIKKDVKVTISWQVPEKVVTISESEYDEMFRKYNQHPADLKVIADVKEEIFKGEV